MIPTPYSLKRAILMLRRLAGLFFFVTFPLPPLLAQLTFIDTKNIRTITLEKANEYIVPHSIRCFENAFSFYQKVYRYSPWDRQNLFVQDLRDYGNAAALTVPRNLVSLSIAPYSYVFETSPANERINSTINHEMVHIVTMDQPGPSDRFFRKLFFGKPGPVSEQPLSVIYRYLTSPRWNSPRWYIEGIAVFFETWNSGGLGRAMGSYDEMVFRTRVKESAELFDILALEAEGTAIDFQGGAVSYMYGTRFMSYLALHYGPEKLVEWTSRAEESNAYFASQFQKVYGIPLATEWQKWLQWEREFQRANLDSIRKNPVTGDRPLSNRPLGSMSKAFYDPSTHRLYTAIRYPGQVPTLAAIHPDHGTFESLADVKGAALYYVTSLAYDPSSQTLFFTTDNNDWRDLNALHIPTGKVRELQDDIRVGDLVFNRADSSLWGVRHSYGISTIVRIPYPYKVWNQIYSLPYGRDVFDLDISADGKWMVAGIAEISGQQKLILMNTEELRKGKLTYEEIFDFEFNTPSNFVFTPDGKYLYGSSYYTGASNIYRYTFETKTMEIMTNCETGYFRPIPLSDDSLIAFRYTAAGFIPVKLANQPVQQVGAIRFLGNEILERHPVIAQWKLDSPSPEKFPFDTLAAGDYKPFGNVGLTSVYPVVEGYKDFAAFGVRLNFSDIILLHNMDITLSYTPNRLLSPGERFHALYHHRFLEWTIRATYNAAHFYDLFGPTKASRKGYSLGIQYKKYILYDDPKTFDYTLSGMGYWGLERLPDFQNVGPQAGKRTFDRFFTLKAALTYKHFERSIGAVDDEKGVLYQLTSGNTYVLSKLHPRVSAAIDYGIALPINHSSLWLRTSGGVAVGNRSDPFDNFYFGGFGNNWIDYLDAKRYREDHSFPGVELNAVGGTNYLKGMLEWTLPPIRFRNLGVPSLYSNWARIGLFSSGIVTNVDSDRKRSLMNVGGQIDFRISFLSSFESTLSFGYAMAREGNRETDELMISLKILK
ncbi:MAG TPA: hypothetical protein VNN76_09815 [Bacteroidota bacterium]|nr:hypothetical protein [Bacteroidota bacterium]